MILLKEWVISREQNSKFGQAMQSTIFVSNVVHLLHQVFKLNEEKLVPIKELKSSNEVFKKNYFDRL